MGQAGVFTRAASTLGLAGTVFEKVASAEEGFAQDSSGPLPLLELESPVPETAPGIPSAASGEAAVEGLLRAGALCLDGRAAAMVTPPVHKSSLREAGYHWEGQTQLLGKLGGTRRFGMLACSGRLRVFPITRHMGIREALNKLDSAMVARGLRIAHEAARNLLGLENPRIALAGMNPHASDGGAFGDEEERVLLPGIKAAFEEWGFKTEGPAVPDIVFHEGAAGKWDVVVALYHDQAFIPLRMLDRSAGHTVLVGSPILRTSPMHGPACDLAGKGGADCEPFAQALLQAIAYVDRSCSKSSIAEKSSLL